MYDDFKLKNTILSPWFMNKSFSLVSVNTVCLESWSENVVWINSQLCSGYEKLHAWAGKGLTLRR